MSVKIKLISVLLLCAVMLSLGACAVHIDPPRDMTSEEEAFNMGFTAVEHDGKIAAGSYEYLSVNIKLDYVSEVTWSSSNPEIAVVDSAGRVDCLKEGKAVITAHAKTAAIDYEVEITKPKKEALSYSTAITANEDYVSSNLVAGSEKTPYSIIVNEYNCVVTVYAYNIQSENYNIPVRTMVCSTGDGGSTPNIEQRIGDKADWVYLSDGNYYRYATYIGEDLMFQSSPYTKEDAASLNAEEYNKIGTPATAKNIRLSLADAKWIYDNCQNGTLVKIVNSDNKDYYFPLGVPVSMKLSENSKSLKWDPTDSSKDNPYTKLSPVISGADDIVIEMETGFDLYEGVTAVDTCGNDISGRIKIDGNFDRNTEGRYVISYYVTDDLGRTTRADREITVTEDLSKFATTSATE